MYFYPFLLLPLLNIVMVFAGMTPLFFINNIFIEYLLINAVVFVPCAINQFPVFALQSAVILVLSSLFGPISFWLYVLKYIILFTPMLIFYIFI